MTDSTPTNSSPGYPLEGGCTCGDIRYRLVNPPLIVHCCHCTWCQRETGSAFVINAVCVIADVERISPSEPDMVHTPSSSGCGQDIARCPRCRIAVWSHYSGGGQLVRFLRAGTLDKEVRNRVKPDVHIYTESKLEWVPLPEGVPSYPKLYDYQKEWSKEVDERRYAMFVKIQEAYKK